MLLKGVPIEEERDHDIEEFCGTDEKMAMEELDVIGVKVDPSKKVTKKDVDKLKKNLEAQYK